MHPCRRERWFLTGRAYRQRSAPVDLTKSTPAEFPRLERHSPGIERWLDQYFLHHLRCASRLPCSLVDFSIFPRRRVPGEIFIHAVTHERLPGSLIAKGHERLLDRQQQRLTVVFGELKAGTFAGTRVPGFDGIVEAAGSTHDGHGAVFEAVDLVQTTRLISGWHQEHVRAG